jgi:Mor family transcriptional regulator
MTTFLTEMRDILAREIKSLPIESEVEKVINNVIRSITKQYGGQPIYIKKSDDLNVRNREIYKKSNGRNVNQLCREYDLCAQQIRLIVKKQHAAKQNDIFHAREN